jgi:hypothetical protein
MRIHKEDNIFDLISLLFLVHDEEANLSFWGFLLYHADHGTWHLPILEFLVMCLVEIFFL